MFNSYVKLPEGVDHFFYILLKTTVGVLNGSGSYNGENDNNPMDGMENTIDKAISPTCDPQKLTHKNGDLTSKHKPKYRGIHRNSLEFIGTLTIFVSESELSTVPVN